MRTRTILLGASLLGAVAGVASQTGLPNAETMKPVGEWFVETFGYANCDTVRNLGKAPLHAGDPGYHERLDADGDGIACEPFRGR